MMRVYISGPMSRASFCRCDRPSASKGNCPFHDFVLPDDGVDPWDYNYPAFEEAAARLRTLGHEPVSPHTIGQHDGWTWDDYMREAIAMQATCRSVYMLPGWRNSRGATVEYYVAQALGQRVWGADA